MNKVDKYLTITLLSLLCLAQVWLGYTFIRGYFELKRTMAELQDMDGTLVQQGFAESMSNWESQYWKMFAIVCLFVLTPIVIGFLRFRFPKRPGLTIAFYLITGIYVLLFVLVRLLEVGGSDSMEEPDIDVSRYDEIGDSALLAKYYTDSVQNGSSPSSQVIYLDNKDSITLQHSENGRPCFGDQILYNGIEIDCQEEGGFVYGSTYNKVIRSGDKLFLFIEQPGSPNFNYLTAFEITPRKATFQINCVYNDERQGSGPAPFTDMDEDGFLEIGGFNVNEAHPSPDSMYYNPGEFYEIRNGKIQFDRSLTKKMAIRENGLYLEDPLDKMGLCCKVIPKPKNRQ